MSEEIKFTTRASASMLLSPWVILKLVLPNGFDEVLSKEIIESEEGVIKRFNDLAKERVIILTSAHVSNKEKVSTPFTSVFALSLFESFVEIEKTERGVEVKLKSKGIWS